ncbi:carboxypeptidase regulatory-like domain-containing protein [Nocardioides sp. zg-536]|uniref:Carboxypeptidase regulatory-like domain-containing protein n=1 Tax=Nocardioides faecalis TaxID=2803858 RepID=A0A939BVC6_9ACTN|nr:carboxypeptidase regulatory-like domain-containing protein [Nocardioides faecalis]MBM9459432.1 carboxypeptidase regulatory-like domain-containing protein [Nocardioides faecalis]QVI59461.1 carboxypeptidase regulatory-like domain-containing protein [Nocardioides faecalis]
MRARKFLLAGAVTAMAVGLSAAPVMTPVAHATTEGSFNVLVRSTESGDALSGAKVQLYSASTGAAVQAAATTDGDGQATIAGLSDGRYTAKVSGTGYFEEYTRVATIGDGSEYTYEYVYLDPITPVQTAKLRGKVTVDGTEGRYPTIYLYPGTATQQQVDNWEVDYVYASGQRNGLWGRVLAAGSYKVRACSEDADYNRSGCAWVGGATADSATVITVAANQTKVVPDLDIVTGAPAASSRVTGKVIGAGGAGIVGVRVYLYGPDATDIWDYVSSTSTDSLGVYSFRDDDVPAGSYRLRFDDSRGEYVGEFHNDVPLSVDDPATWEDDSYLIPAGAGTVTVPATGAVTANASLAKAPVPPATSGLSGRLVNDAGSGVAGYVEIYDARGSHTFSVSTRRDGTFSVPADQLAPGGYRLWAEGDGVVGSWNGGAPVQAKAPLVTVPVVGVANIGALRLQRYGAIGGTVALTANAAGDLASSRVVVYDADGEEYSSWSTDSNGSYTADELAPGTYYVRAEGSRSSLFDHDVELPYIPQYWAGRYTLSSATPVVVRPGATTARINFTLSNRLSAVTAPSITGSPTLGKVLTARAGTWTRAKDVVFTYQWKRGGKVVGTGAAYKVAKADQGASLTVTVTATDRRGSYVTGAAVSKAVKVAKPPKKKVKKKAKKKTKKKAKKAKKK